MDAVNLTFCDDDPFQASLVVGDDGDADDDVVTSTSSLQHVQQQQNLQSQQKEVKVKARVKKRRRCSDIHVLPVLSINNNNNDTELQCKMAGAFEDSTLPNPEAHTSFIEDDFSDIVLPFEEADKKRSEKKSKTRQKCLTNTVPDSESLIEEESPPPPLITTIRRSSRIRRKSIILNKQQINLATPTKENLRKKRKVEATEDPEGTSNKILLAKQNEKSDILNLSDVNKPKVSPLVSPEKDEDKSPQITSKSGNESGEKAATKRTTRRKSTKKTIKPKSSASTKLSPELPTENLDDLYRNKNFVMPVAKKWVTIMESPKITKSGTQQALGKKEVVRSIQFEDVDTLVMKYKKRKQKGRQKGWRRLPKARAAKVEKRLLEKLEELDQFESEIQTQEMKSGESLSCALSYSMLETDISDIQSQSASQSTMVFGGESQGPDLENVDATSDRSCQGHTPDDIQVIEEGTSHNKSQDKESVICDKSMSPIDERKPNTDDCLDNIGEDPVDSLTKPTEAETIRYSLASVAEDASINSQENTTILYSPSEYNGLNDAFVNTSDMQSLTDSMVGRRSGSLASPAANCEPKNPVSDACATSSKETNNDSEDCSKTCTTS